LDPFSQDYRDAELRIGKAKSKATVISVAALNVSKSEDGRILLEQLKEELHVEDFDEFSGAEPIDPLRLAFIQGQRFAFKAIEWWVGAGKKIQKEELNNAR